MYAHALIVLFMMSGINIQNDRQDHNTVLPILSKVENLNVHDVEEKQVATCRIII